MLVSGYSMQWQYPFEADDTGFAFSLGKATLAFTWLSWIFVSCPKHYATRSDIDHFVVLTHLDSSPFSSSSSSSGLSSTVGTPFTPATLFGRKTLEITPSTLFLLPEAYPWARPLHPTMRQWLHLPPTLHQLLLSRHQPMLSVHSSIVEQVNLTN